MREENKNKLIKIIERINALCGEPTVSQLMPN
jgi:hypothetical protein